MGFWQASSSSRDFWITPPRGCISLSTGKPYVPPIDGRAGGEPYRMETDEEYERRIAEYRARLSSKNIT